MILGLLEELWPVFRANRLRTLLTMLGMVIGVGAVVLMGAIGKGAELSINQTIESMGSNLLMVLPGSGTGRNGIHMGMGATPTLTLGDAAAVAELSRVNAVSPLVNGTASVVYGSENWATSIYGVGSQFFVIQHWSLQSGRFLTEADDRSAMRVAVIGQTVAGKLFGDTDPTGKVIRIQKTPYLIVGTLNARGQSLDGRDQDDAVFVPVTTAQRKLFGSRFHGTVRLIIIQADSTSALPDLIDPVTQVIRARHRLGKAVDNDFSVQNLTALANTAVEATKIFALLLAAIASISLIVGGIGIMNILLVSVSERTREIGLRASLGARRKDILMQFLFEAIVIALAGCTIGVVLGSGLAWVIHLIWDMPVVVTVASMVMAFGIAGAIAVFFGYYPAYRAAHLNPIEALRYQ